MPNIVIIIAFIVLCIVTVEAISWAYSVYNHCIWARKQDINEKRLTISYPALAFFSSFSGVASFLVWCGYIYILQMVCLPFECIVLMFFIVFFFQVITIHAWYIVSLYISVPFEFIPHISQYIVNLLSKLTKGDNKLRYMNLKEWDRVFNASHVDKSLIISFLNVIPSVVWTKDIDNKFTYVNRSACKTLLLYDEHEVMGKTSAEIALLNRQRGMVYTFGEMCCESDEITKENNEPTFFYQTGLIDNKHKTFRVLKCPIYNKKGDIIGTIGASRDVSFHANYINMIGSLIYNGDLERAMSEFLIYKMKYEKSSEITLSKDFRKDME